VDQLALILDRSRTTVRFNSEWLGKLSFAEIVSLSSRMTVAQVLERDDFQKRLAAHQPVSLHELLYPLAQAYDSVAIEADIEMGGQDQTFNILAGRDLQRELGQEPQVALFMPLLVGLDGEKKMSKSLGNYVGITESPAQMHGKLLSMPDEAMAAYFDLCTTMEKPEYETLLNEAVEGRRNPKEIKRRLAREIVSAYHGQDAAAKADEEFERIHARHEDPGEVEEVALPAEAVKDGKVWLCRLIVATGLAASTGEARRLVEQGGFRLNGHRLADPKADLPIESVDGALLQAGNRRFRRVRV
jgi:tyrosyl-tRNA synthetase